MNEIRTQDSRSPFQVACDRFASHRCAHLPFQLWWKASEQKIIKRSGAGKFKRSDPLHAVLIGGYDRLSSREQFSEDLALTIQEIG